MKEYDRQQSSSRRSRSRKLTRKQKEFMADFMLANPELARNKGSGLFGKATLCELWQQFAREANQLGPQKDPSHWLKAWTDAKCRARMKMVSIEEAKQRMGNSEKIPTLTPCEVKIMAAMGEEGFEDTPECDTLPEDHASLDRLVDTELKEEANDGSNGSAPEGFHTTGKESLQQDLEESRRELVQMQERQNEISQTVADTLKRLADESKLKNELLTRLCEAVEALTEAVKKKNDL